MPTTEEIRAEWKNIRSSLGNLLCCIDGKLESLKTLDEAYQKGVRDGCHDAYEKGLEDAWEMARQIPGLTTKEACDIWGLEKWLDVYDMTANQALEKWKEYNDKQVVTNGRKFVETFGFMPGYEILDDGRSYYPSLEKFFESDYKPPEGNDE